MTETRTVTRSEAAAAVGLNDERRPGGPRGDPPAFETVVAEHRQRVTGLVYRLLGWSDDVEDVVQDVFVAVLNNLAKFRGEAQLGTWIYRIAVNVCRRHRRRRMLRLRFWRPTGELPEAGAETPDSRGRRETSARVRAAVVGLPAGYREVVVLRYLEELPVLDIAVILGLSRNAVEVRLSRAREQLKQVLGNWMEM